MNSPLVNDSSSPAWPTLLLAKSTRKETFFACVLIAVSLLLFKPALFLHYKDLFLGGTSGDTAIYLWLSNLFPYFVTPSHWFETNGFYPYQGSLAFSDNWVLPSFCYWLLKSLSSNDAFAWNTCVLLSQISFGLFSYLLFYALSGSFIWSILFGALTPQISSFQAHLGHPQLQHGWIVPAVILCLFRWIQTQKAFYGFLCGIALSASFLCSIYLTIFSGYLLCILFLTFCVLRLSMHAFTIGASFIAALVLGLLPSIPFILPYRQVIAAFGNRGLWEPEAFAATIFSYFSYGSFHWNNFLYHSISHSEANLGIGYIAPILVVFCATYVARKKEYRLSAIAVMAALIGLIAVTLLPYIRTAATFPATWLPIIAYLGILFIQRRLAHRSNWVLISNTEIFILLFVSALLFLQISFGPISTTGISSWNPFLLAFNYLPGISGIRAISRAGLISSYLFLLIAFLFLAIQTERKKLHRSVTLILIALLYGENLTVDYPLEPISHIQKEITDNSAYISSSDVVLTLPYGDTLSDQLSTKNFFSYASIQNQSLWGLTASKAVSINGFTGVKTKITQDLPFAVSSFPSNDSFEYLSEFIGLNKIILLPEFFNGKKFLEVISNLTAYNPIISVVFADESAHFAILSFQPSKRAIFSDVQNITFQSSTRQVTCDILYPTNSHCSPVTPEKISALLLHNKASVPFVINEDKIVFQLPIAAKRVPFLTIKVGFDLDQKPLLANCMANFYPSTVTFYKEPAPLLDR